MKDAPRPFLICVFPHRYSKRFCIARKKNRGLRPRSATANASGTPFVKD
jgi:hypothetical protein